MYDPNNTLIRENYEVFATENDPCSGMLCMHAMLFNVAPSCTRYPMPREDYLVEKSLNFVENYLAKEGFELIMNREGWADEDADDDSDRLYKKSGGMGAYGFFRLFINKEREILVSHDSGHPAIACTFNCADKSAGEFANKFIRDFKKACRKPKRKVSNIQYIVKGYRFCTESMEVKSLPKSFSIKRYYNDDFEPVHKNIKKFIAEDRSGLVILHGEQGTGKTTYLRHLIASCKRNFVYLPMDMAGSLANPDLISFIKSDIKDSVIIIEDCEQLLQDRGDAPYALNTGLSNILNIADGLLGDSLCLKFICTFNNDVRKIDKALLRKGRLIDKYEFKKLSSDKTAALIKERYGLEGNFGEMTLSDICNFDVENHGTTQTHGAIGFNPSKK